MLENNLKVVSRPDGRHEVQTLTGEVLAVCASNADAWRWIDKHSGAGQEGYGSALSDPELGAVLVTGERGADGQSAPDAEVPSKRSD